MVLVVVLSTTVLVVVVVVVVVVPFVVGVSHLQALHVHFCVVLKVSHEIPNVTHVSQDFPRQVSFLHTSASTAHLHPAQLQP